MRPITVLSSTWTILALLAWAPAASAMRFQERPTWMVGVGWGFGRGFFDDAELGEHVYRSGSAPQIHFGWKPSTRFMVGTHYEAWMIELGEVPIKIRRSLQNLSLGLTWYPGNPVGPSGGIYLRAGGGLGWAGTAEVPVEEEEAQTHGKRIDEWGVSVFGDAGYEFWISGNATISAGLSLNYLDIGESIVDAGLFAGGLLGLTLYF